MSGSKCSILWITSAPLEVVGAKAHFMPLFCRADRASLRFSMFTLALYGYGVVHVAKELPEVRITKQLAGPLVAN